MIDDLDVDNLLMNKELPQLITEKHGNNSNLNNHLVNVQKGLKNCLHPVILKVRSDLIPLESIEFEEEIKNYPTRINNIVYKEKLIVGHIYFVNPYGPLQLNYHPSDWFAMGLAEDVRAMYDIPLHTVENVEDGNGRLRYRSEQYIFLKSLQKLGYSVDIRWDGDITTRENGLSYLMNNFVILDTNKYFKSLKYHVQMGYPAILPNQYCNAWNKVNG
jgi:hypothetical protein